MIKTEAKEKKVLKKGQKDAIFVACLVTLPLIHYLIFYVYVNINSVALAFQTFDITTGKYFWNDFFNFKLLFTDFVQKGFLETSIKNSFIYFIIQTLVGTTACLLFSFYIFKKRFLSKLYKTMLFLPSIISAIALVLMYKYFADYAIPALFAKIDVKVPALASDWDTIFPTVVFYGIWMGFGTSLLMYSGAMSNISDSVMEAAKIDGAGEFRQFFHVAVPLIWPTLTTFLVNAVATIFSSDMHLYAFYGGGAEHHVYTFGYFLLKTTRDATDLAGYPYPAAAGLILTAVSVPLTFLVRTLLNKFGPKVD